MLRTEPRIKKKRTRAKRFVTLRYLLFSFLFHSSPSSERKVGKQVKEKKRTIFFSWSFFIFARASADDDYLPTWNQSQIIIRFPPMMDTPRFPTAGRPANESQPNRFDFRNFWIFISAESTFMNNYFFFLLCFPCLLLLLLLLLLFDSYSSVIPNSK